MDFKLSYFRAYLSSQQILQLKTLCTKYEIERVAQQEVNLKELQGLRTAYEEQQLALVAKYEAEKRVAQTLAEATKEALLEIHDQEKHALAQELASIQQMLEECVRHFVCHPAL